MQEDARPLADHATPGGVRIETALSRDLGLPSALAIGVGTMIAAGIFTLSGLAVRNVGSSAIVAFLLAAGVALLTALAYCEFVSLYPESGEGFLYARRTFRPIAAFLVGLALFLGYTSSCGFYISSLASYFQEFVWHAPFQSLSGVVALAALTLLNIKGTRESGRFQIIVTAAKVVLLAWFVAGGMRAVRSDDLIDKFSTDFFKIAGTAALVFVTFFGFSAIAASAGEVRNPIKTIPRAIFISMGLVTVLYCLVVLTVIAAGLTEYTEAAMGTAARQFLGPVGQAVIVWGALFSMISASNASIMAGSRVLLAMSRDGHVPRGFGAVNPRTRTPIVAIVLVGAAILIFVLALPLEDLAHFANAVLLLALILVNIALIVHRRKYPDMARPFRVPLVPFVPGLAIAANLYLLWQIIEHPVPLAMAGGCLLLGLGGFVAWRGLFALEATWPAAPSRVALERSTASQPGRFRVLVPLANPANVPQLIDLAAAIASKRNGEIVALRVALVPDQLPPHREQAHVERQRPVLERAHAAALAYGVPTTSLVVVGHDIARAILETARARDCDLILMGWKGYTTTTRRVLGEVVDAVANHARSDLILVKQVGQEPLRKLLLPTAGGEHARAAESYASDVVRAHGGSLTVCHVAPPDLADAEAQPARKRLDDAVNRIRKAGGLTIDRKLIHHRSVSVGIIEAASGYDAVVVGAAGHSAYPQILFGSIPESIAKHADRTVLLVKHYHPVKELVGRMMAAER